ncbi:MAG: hypothetical protein PHR28_09670 [candidate division Zixibacteria bacterium]|nr:hypothetical protein [candidate division Zixibacteria bacterium]
MLDTLRNEIARVVATRGGKGPDETARTFIYLASPSLMPVKKWFEEHYPQKDPDAEFLSPWLVSQEGTGDFAGKVNNAVICAYDANLIGTLVMKGTKIANSLNQVLVIADLSEAGIEKRIVEECRVIAETLQRCSGGGAPVFWTGIFIIGRVGSGETETQPPDAVKEKTRKRTRFASKETVKSLLEKLSDELFGRVFLLNVSNSQGILIPEDRDETCLLGQLLYFLMTYPMATGQAGNYINWINANSASNNYVTGFSAVSFILPVETILEVVAVARGTEIMNEGLLNLGNRDRFGLYLLSFLQKNFLTAGETLENRLSTDKELPLLNPTTSFPDFDEMPLDDYLETMSNIDASLPGAAMENHTRMQSIAERCLNEVRISLDDHSESMAGREQGGLLMADQFLEGLQSHIEKITPKDGKPTQYDDPGGEIRTLGGLAAKSPRKAAVFARGFVLPLASILAVNILPLAPIWKTVLLIALPLLCVLLSIFVYISTRQELKNHVLNLQSLLRAKFEILMADKKAEVVAKHMNDVQAEVKTTRELARAAVERIKTLVKYFGDEYNPGLREEDAFWKFAVKETQFRDYVPLCRVNIGDVARDYLALERPLFPWRRLIACHEPTPDPWEFGLVEKAGLRVLPDCGDIINLTIQSRFNPEMPQYQGYLELITRLGHPFLTVNAMRKENGAITTCMMAEIGPPAQSPMLGGFINDLSRHFTLYTFGELPPYRLSLFGFMEGVSVDDVDLQ